MGAVPSRIERKAGWYVSRDEAAQVSSTGRDTSGSSGWYRWAFIARASRLKLTSEDTLVIGHALPYAVKQGCDVADTLRVARLRELAPGIHGHQYDGGEYGDDAEHDEYLDEREGAADQFAYVHRSIQYVIKIEVTPQWLRCYGGTTDSGSMEMIERSPARSVARYAMLLLDADAEATNV